MEDYLESNIADEDSDGITDHLDPDNDTDGDGKSNAQEAMDGTDPNDSADFKLPPVYCNATSTTVVEVTSPTGKIWMDRNLGATQAATSKSDAAAYGDLYQWGRDSDGHQCRNSTKTSSKSTTDVPDHGKFINGNNPIDNWRKTQNNDLWQGVTGKNNPCPSGFRLPTNDELSAERNIMSGSGADAAFASVLKLPAAGFREAQVFDANITDIGGGHYWTSTAAGYGAYTPNYLFFSSGSSLYMHYKNKAHGLSVRCIKD